MKAGFIGLGKMGAQMVQRLLKDGHDIVVLDVNQEAVASMVDVGATAATDTADMASQLGTGAVVWVMIPEQFVEDELHKIVDNFATGTVVVDGGNSDYRNTIAHAAALNDKGISLVDVGTSGGVHGLANGFSMMVGGDKQSVDQVAPLIESLAQKDGWGHFGPVGTGHFTKMVHNGIEYGAMQAYAEGYRIIKEGPFENVDLGKLADVWQHGSINESFLNGLIAGMLKEDGELSGAEGYVHESGEARWTLETAKELGIDTPVIQAAFNVRLASQQGDINYATKFLAQLRNEFGGHAVNKQADKK